MKLLVMLLLTGAALVGQTEYPKTDKLAATAAYSHVVVAPSAKLCFISGQVANDAKGNLVGRGDLKAQTEQVFANLKAALEAAGTSFDNVVKITWYVKDYKPESLAILRDVRSRYVGKTSASRKHTGGRYGSFSE